jgi:hypothetical protein
VPCKHGRTSKQRSKQSGIPRITPEQSPHGNVVNVVNVVVFFTDLVAVAVISVAISAYPAIIAAALAGTLGGSIRSSACLLGVANAAVVSEVDAKSLQSRSQSIPERGELPQFSNRNDRVERRAAKGTATFMVAGIAPLSL